MTRALTSFLGFALGLSVAVAAGCGGAQTRPPCAQTTWLIPEETVLQRVRYTYDDDERLVMTETLVGERDHSVERVEVAYDEDGRVASETISGHDEAGHPLELVVHYTYDDAGRVSSVDWIAGTEVHRGETYAYDAAGRVSEIVYYGPGPQSAVERVIRHTYSDDGLRERVDTDLLGDGTIDLHVITVYDEEGRPLTIENSRGENVLAARTTYRYHEDGRPLGEEIDRGANGLIESVRRYVYDEEDKDLLLSIEIDEGNDGTIERRIAYTYDEEGRLVSETDLISERGADPAASQRVTSSRTEYDYSCWDRDR
jgi:YD repeat-containing protein